MILVECYGDEALLKSLGFKDIFHNFGSGEVGNQLIRSNNKIAMIDADPTKTKHRYFQNLQPFKEKKYSINTFMDSNRNNYVVQLDPDLEGYLLKMISETKTFDLLTKHNIPSTRENLHEYLAKRTISKVFETFLKEVIVRNTPHFVYIKSLLEELEGLAQ